MIKKINFQDKTKSTYICDSCLKEITGENRVKIQRLEIKQFDLCENCWKRIRWIIKKHKIKRVD